MALVKFKDLCIDVTSPAVMGPWWAERLGLRLETSATGSVLRGPTPQHTVWLNVVPETKHVKNRVHLDLQTSDDLVFASSPVLSDPELFPWVVHADPEGGGEVDNRFRHLNVGVRRRRIAGGMVVHESFAWRIALNTR